MLKIVGTDKGSLVDEKVLVTDDGKITKYGIILIVLDVLADIGIVYVISRIIKCARKCKNQKM